jgi:hypothetical protein
MQKDRQFRVSGEWALAGGEASPNTHGAWPN